MVSGEDSPILRENRPTPCEIASIVGKSEEWKDCGKKWEEEEKRSGKRMI
jgi:hypothetical protein